MGTERGRGALARVTERNDALGRSVSTLAMTREHPKLAGRAAILLAVGVVGALVVSSGFLPATAAGAAGSTCPIAVPTIGHGLSPTATGAVYEVPATIDATGTREVSSELQLWLVDTVRSGTADRPNVIRFQPGGRYWVDYTIILRRQAGGIPRVMWPDLPKFSLDHIRIDLNGATLEQRTTRPYALGTTVFDPRKQYGDPILMTGGALGVEITNGTIAGPIKAATYQQRYEEWTGIRITGNRSDNLPVRNIWIHDITISHVFGDFIRITAGTTKGEHITDILIEDNRMNVAGRHAIVLNGGTNLVIRRNDIRNAARIDFDSEPTGAQGFLGVAITENTGNASPLGYFQLAAPVRSTASNIQFVGNTITNGNFRVKVGGGLSNPRRCFVFARNRNLGTSEYTRSLAYKSLIRVAHWDGVTIERNFDRVRASGKVVAVDLEGSTNTSVTDNTWVNALDDQCAGVVCPEP
jgi:hypothetical protein